MRNVGRQGQKLAVREDFRTVLGPVLKATRVKAGLTQEVLANSIEGLGATSITNYERAQREPSLAILEAIAHACHVQLHEIIAEAVGEQIAYPSQFKDCLQKMRAQLDECEGLLGGVPEGADEPPGSAHADLPDAEITDAQTKALRALGDLMGVLGRESSAVLADPARAEEVLPVLEAMRRGLSGSGAA